jgi:hypothetical protein
MFVKGRREMYSKFLSRIKNSCQPVVAIINAYFMLQSSQPPSCSYVLPIKEKKDIKKNEEKQS